MPRYTTSIEMDRSSGTASSLEQAKDPFAHGADVLGAGLACGLGVVPDQRVVDPVVRLEGCVGARVRLEPLLARRAQHVPDHPEHRGEKLIAGGVADDLVKTDVLVGVRLARRDLLLLRDEQVVQLVELRWRYPRRGERGDRWLDDAPELDDVLQ